jgi:6-phosphogluconolactonase (cycloisomerase 2 family)
MPDSLFAYVGCFTTAQRKARGTGIDICRIDPVSGSWKRVGHVGGLTNPSFLITDAAKTCLYSAHGDGDYASAFAIAADGSLTALGQAATGGRNGVHPALDPTGKFMIVANYGTGSVAVLPVREDGSLGDFIQLLDLPGPLGPHRTEQTVAHPHHVVFDPSGHFVIVPDKGLDKVFVLRFRDGAVALHSEIVMRPGAGPRHMVFHPNLPFAFVLNELDSTVATCRWDRESGTLTPVHLASSLLPDFFGASTAAAIVITPDGKHIFTSNRGQDSVAHFTFDAGQARLDTIGWTPSEGRDPRFMTLDPSGKRLYVANEQGDTILGFDLAEGSGRPLRRGVVLASASPCTIAFC